MKVMKNFLALMLVGFVSITASTASLGAQDSVQFTLEIVAEDQITLNAVTQVTKGLNAIDALQQVVAMGVKDTDWGPQIMSLGGVEAIGNTYWALWVNGDMSMVGAQDVVLDVDTVIRLILTPF